MSLFKEYRERHPDLFRYIKSDQVHPHDHFIANTALRLIPKSVTPNQITLFRIAATPVVFLLTLFGYYRIGIIAFLLVALTDAMDGSLARTQHKITKFGMLFDPLADKFLIGSMALLLMFQYFHPFLGLAVLGLEIAFICLAFIARYKFKTVKAANIWGKIKMILQVFAVFVTLAALLLNATQLFTVAAALFGLAIGFAIVSLFFQGV